MPSSVDVLSKAATQSVVLFVELLVHNSQSDFFCTVVIQWDYVYVPVIRGWVVCPTIDNSSVNYDFNMIRFKAILLLWSCLFYVLMSIFFVLFEP